MNRPLDAFYLPPALAGTVETTLQRFGPPPDPLEIRLPLLTSEVLAQWIEHLRAARAKHLATRPIAATLRSLDRVPAIEIIRNGQVAARIDPKNGVESKRTFNLKFKESGWFLVRAVADNDKTFRFASTAPFYVEVGKNKSHISKKSATFFKDWTDERIERLRNAQIGRAHV